MKTIAVIVLAFALSPAVALAAQGAGSRIYVASGDVFVAQGKNPAHRAMNSEPIFSDTVVSTGDNGAALIKFEDGQVVTVQANSAFQVREYQYDAGNIRNSSVVFLMFKGGMRFITGLIGQKRPQAIRLSTPAATIGIRGTDFMLVMVGKSMYGQVLTGSIDVTNAAGTTAIGAGQSAVVASSSTLASVASIPSGTFSELRSIPTDPAAIAVPAAAPAPAPMPAPAAAAAPAPALPAVPTPIPAPAAPVSGAATGAAPAPPVAPKPGALAVVPGGKAESIEEKKAAKPEVSGEEELAKPGKVTERAEMGAETKSGMGLTAKIGTLGYGFEVNFGISDRFSSRVGLNAFNYKRNANSSDLNYDFEWKLKTVSAFVDWYPFEGSFRASIGALYDDNKASFNANPTSGTFIINGVTYSTAQVGSFGGTMSFGKAAPYVGIGWGNPAAKNKGWGLVTDIGALYQGTPKIDLLVTCVDPLVCAQLQSDAAAENIKLQDDLSHFKWWPVVAIGISYQW